MQYKVDVSYENNIPLSLEELTPKGAYQEWCKSNIHLLDLQGEKCMYVGKQGLIGRLDKDDCPYQVKVSKGSTFTTYNWSGTTNWIEFSPYYQSERKFCGVSFPSGTYSYN
jgi:hypothetical protein